MSKGAVASAAVDAVKIYGSGATEVRALDGLSVGFEGGAFTAIMGPSGSGKSTLLHCLAALDRVTGGRIELDGEDVSALDERQLTMRRRDKVGFIFQAFNLVPTLTALENITLPMALAGRDHDPAWLDTIVDTVGIRPRLGHRPAELS
ncbi:MAG: ABC transporter ATP-binding protein, partial [Mycobacteriales bacterium]